jgi:hypothetical protein
MLVTEVQSSMDGNQKEMVFKDDENQKWYQNKPQTHEQQSQQTSIQRH